MAHADSDRAVLIARLAVALVIVCLIAGSLWYGFSPGVRQRVWQDLADRPGGPMTFRLILQPAMAALMALRDGVEDAKAGRSPYLWTLLGNRAERGPRLWEGVIATARIILLGIVMDAVYQLMVLHTFYPGEAAIVALLLAFLPYLLLRGPFTRVARWWLAHKTRPVS